MQETPESTVQAIAFLARSPGRVELLCALAEAGSCEKRALRERSETTRTTFQRNADALEERGWIHREGETYAITPTGRAVAEAFGPLVESVGVAEHLEPVFRWVPDGASEFGLDLATLADATVVEPTPVEPYAPVTLHIEALKRADHGQLLLPVMGLDAMEVSRQRLAEAGTEYEVIVQAEIAEALRARPAYRTSLEGSLETGGLSIRVFDGDVPYYLGLFDDAVQLGAVDGNGVPKGFLESEDASVRKWAEATYEWYRAASDPFALE